MFQTTSLSTILQVCWEQDLEQPLHISCTAQEITAYSPIIFRLEIRSKKFPFCNPLPKTPFSLSRELPHKSQNHLNNFHCPFPLHPPSSPNLPALHILLTKYLMTAVRWFGKHIYIKLKTLKSHGTGWNVSQIPVHFWNTWMVSRGNPKTLCNWPQWSQLWVRELRSSSSESLEQTLPTNKLSNHLMQASRKIMSSLFFK